ncbi:2845_t:CDS:2 [Paraglomus brasilianum]|uniref:2845_t:CDS:1 n=1 Tax=Paraglomus brasilianum TaxID=144538 RepID=A0A9N9AM30_9GLOM|nr:2845_t:CDS:2 [Paraglomus brasilianum]
MTPSNGNGGAKREMYRSKCVFNGIYESKLGRNQGFCLYDEYRWDRLPDRSEGRSTRSDDISQNMQDLNIKDDIKAVRQIIA